jgi:hypothetical protein
MPDLFHQELKIEGLKLECAKMLNVVNAENLLIQDQEEETGVYFTKMDLTSMRKVTELTTPADSSSRLNSFNMCRYKLRSTLRIAVL